MAARTGHQYARHRQDAIVRLSNRGLSGRCSSCFRKTREHPSHLRSLSRVDWREGGMAQRPAIRGSDFTPGRPSRIRIRRKSQRATLQSDDYFLGSFAVGSAARDRKAPRPCPLKARAGSWSLRPMKQRSWSGNERVEAKSRRHSVIAAVDIGGTKIAVGMVDDGRRAVTRTVPHRSRTWI